jgi:hypothetical protein
MQMNIKWVASRLLAQIAPATSARAVRSPVFIVGFNKSGKTLLKNILAKHPDVTGYPGEANALWHPGYYPWYKSDLKIPPMWLDPSTYVKNSLERWSPRHRIAIQAGLGAYQRLSGKRVLLVDSAMITFMVPELLELFPDARFIHFYRDGRVCSYLTAQMEHAKILDKNVAYRKGGYYFETFDELLPKIASYWAETIVEMDRTMARLSDSGAGTFMELSYEEFCAEPDGSLKRIFEFLDIQTVQFSTDHIVNSNSMLLKEIPTGARKLLRREIGASLGKKGYIT